MKKYMAGWNENPENAEKQVKKTRSRKDWKTLRHLSRHEYHVKVKSPKSQTRPVSSATKKMLIQNQRPATDVLSEAEGKVGNVFVQSESRAQSASYA